MVSVNNFTSDFSIFWKAYPRKVAKGAAEKIWARLKHTPDLLPRMLSAIEKQKKTDQWRNPQYIPHPATWLNRKQWLDGEDESLEANVTVTQERFIEKRRELENLRERLWSQRHLSPQSTDLPTNT
jgi:hypothetical protein